MRGRAFAKLNLALRVLGTRADGMHSIWSLAQSVDWADEISVEPTEGVDEFLVIGAELPTHEENLAWRGVSAMRGGSDPAIRMVLDKSIAVAAGLGGGSADAALGLALGAEMFGCDVGDAVAAAADLGADVAFCLSGGRAILEGVGDRVSRLSFVDDFVVAIVVPPFELATPAVYGRYDEFDGSAESGFEARDLPVSLRDHAPLGNDLQAAAVDLAPELGDWLHDTSVAWGQPVAMSGSGPSLFSFFGSKDEATEAVAAIRGARAGIAASPLRAGWEIESGGRLPPAPWG